jgi:probable selenium-dependent hydroxylase accessory protein YqeC
VESHDVQTTLAGALGATAPQLIALTGAGGKTAVLQQLCAEFAGQPGGVLATTTTAMFARQLSSLGPLLIDEDEATPLARRAREALRTASVVTVALSRAEREKVKGLPPDVVDALWRARTAESVVVEADGSRRLPLKTFGESEPQLPSAATTVVVVAGLDALGCPLDEEHVHRASLLAPLLDVPEGTTVTAELLARSVRLQVERVRSIVPEALVVVLLNKAESDDALGQGVVAGAALLEGLPEGAPGGATGRPDRVVVGSVRRGVYRALVGSAT